MRKRFARRDGGDETLADIAQHDQPLEIDTLGVHFLGREEFRAGPWARNDPEHGGMCRGRQPWGVVSRHWGQCQEYESRCVAPAPGSKGQNVAASGEQCGACLLKSLPLCLNVSQAALNCFMQSLRSLPGPCDSASLIGMTRARAPGRSGGPPVVRAMRRYAAPARVKECGAPDDSPSHRDSTRRTIPKSRKGSTSGSRQHSARAVIVSGWRAAGC